MKKIIFTLLTLVCGVVQSQTLYPETIEIKQINSAEKERVRLCQGHKKYDKQPTGFYVEAGKNVVVNVEILTPADGNVMPTLTVGTMGFNVGGRNTGTSTTLKVGVNTITNHSGGLIWLSFVQESAGTPKGVAKITFTGASEHVRAPRFVYGTTVTSEFRDMLTNYPTPDVLYQSDYVVVVATKEAANTHSKDNNKVEWLNSIHRLLELEDGISGMDNDDVNPIHHRLKAGEVRHLLVENTSASPHAASIGYTGYPHASINRYLTKLGTSSNNTWMLGHELGHQHQQPAYMINGATESTVNIYSYVAERDIQGADYNRTTAARWAGAKSTYLQLPFSKRIYEMNTDELETITGFNRDELKFMVWEHLFLIFGDQFYKNLHRVVREEKVIGGGEDERRAYLIWKASQVSGYDLTEFFNLWGIRVNDAAIKADLRAKMANAKTKGDILDLSAIGRTAESLLAVTGQLRPSWIPITLRGITSSVSGTPEVLDRTGWEVWTSYDDEYGGLPDTAIGGDQPGYIIDGSTATAFAFVKPGKPYGGITVPAGFEPSFTVDMKAIKSFNCVKYMHRLSNTLEWLRARQISVYGYNAGASALTPLKEHHVIDHIKNVNEIIVEFPAVSFQYIKVVIEAWNTVDGGTIQVADFNVGTQIPAEQLPVPDPLKFRVKVTADAGIITSQAGTNQADEDSNYTLNFTLAAGMNVKSVAVDGDAKTPTKNGDTYSLTVKVTNHLDINITSEAGSGVETSSSGNSSVSIYPNPVKAGQPFTVRLGDEFSNADITVYSLWGTKLSEGKANGTQLEQHIEQQGVYILEVKKDTWKFATKIVVK